MSSIALRPRPNPKLLSIVMPCYNEEEVVPVMVPVLTEFLDHAPYPCEVVIVDDGSSDRTVELLGEECMRDSRIKLLRLSRNFGHQFAATAGIDHAAGDAIVLMDADLQDPLEVVYRMVDEYRKGYDVVCGQRIARAGESPDRPGVHRTRRSDPSPVHLPSRSFGHRKPATRSSWSYPSVVSVSGSTCSRMRRKTSSPLYGLGR